LHRIASHRIDLRRIYWTRWRVATALTITNWPFVWLQPIEKENNNYRVFISRREGAVVEVGGKKWMKTEPDEEPSSSNIGVWTAYRGKPDDALS